MSEVTEAAKPSSPAQPVADARAEPEAPGRGLHEHGGTDALGVARHDFSSNANACGPCPLVVEALQQVNAAAYPDPQYTTLIAELSAATGVYPERIVLGASASE